MYQVRPKEKDSKGSKRHGFAADTLPVQPFESTGFYSAASYPARVFKGMRMAGQTGNKKVKVQNLAVVKVITEKNLGGQRLCSGHKIHM